MKGFLQVPCAATTLTSSAVHVTVRVWTFSLETAGKPADAGTFRSLPSPALSGVALSTSSAEHQPMSKPCVLCPQVKSHVAFGKPQVEQCTRLADIAQSRVETEQTRLLVLKAAHIMDVAGNKAAALDIAMIKMVAPSMAHRVIDHAIRVSTD